MMSVSAIATDVIVVSHGQANDPFWSQKMVLILLVRIWGPKDTAPGTFDMVEMAKLIDNEIQPKGIVITLPDAVALGKSVAAIAAGIPVISMNSGSDDYVIRIMLTLDKLSLKLSWWWTKHACRWKKALCVNHEVGNVALDRRCAGFKKVWRNVDI